MLVSINSTADRSNTPVSKSVIISIAPSVDTAAAVAQLRRDISESARIQGVRSARQHSSGQTRLDFAGLFHVAH